MIMTDCQHYFLRAGLAMPLSRCAFDVVNSTPFTKLSRRNYLLLLEESCFIGSDFATS